MLLWRTRVAALCPVVLADDVSQKLAGARVARAAVAGTAKRLAV